ncbi:MAG: cysteine--tRNA ligase [Bdellovibrionaceae bacterium]|nr:cysteine--tRNA ligase [Pseudobdellovibrionaceae bacterium]
MAIQIQDTQTGQKREFTPIREGEVSMYVCGPTVYDFLHIGNFRGAIFFNVVRNWFEKRGFKVTYVYNYTDIDDKIINRANNEGVSPSEISEKYIKEFETDYANLKLTPQTHRPRVSEHVDTIIDLIQSLVDQDKAYTLNGDVYFNVENFSEYGKLSNKNIEDLRAGHRIGVDEGKKHPADFALWKGAKEGEPSWDSPFGPGRPGWHIECSAMSKALLGEQIDIHGGGLDLVFPHHENEIAQSEGASGKTYVNYWMHNNMLEFGNQKMSKSLGNVLTGRSFLTEYNGEILKYMMLQNHYRSTIDFSEAQIGHTIQNLARFYSALALADSLAGKGSLAPVPESFEKMLSEAEEAIEKSMDDDFNTAEFLAHLFGVVREFNKLCRKPGKVTDAMVAVAETFSAWVRKQGLVLALFQEPAAEFLRTLDDMLLAKKDLKRADIDQLVQDRATARAEKNWAKADEVRDKLAEIGILVQDSAEGSTWEVEKG